MFKNDKLHHLPWGYISKEHTWQNTLHVIRRHAMTFRKVKMEKDSLKGKRIYYLLSQNFDITLANFR